MQAFTGNTVSKETLLASLRRHRDNDQIQRGHFWNPLTETGCGVGCTIHDFSPGAEAEHQHYETLFGIPADLAVLEDCLFEHMGHLPDPTAWPLEFIQAIPPGKNLDRDTGRWLKNLLSDHRSPISHTHNEPPITSANTLLSHWLQTGQAPPPLVNEADFTATTHPECDAYARTISQQVAEYVRIRTKSSPYTIDNMFLLDSLATQAVLCYTENRGPAAANDSFPDSDVEGYYLISRMLLETLRTPEDG